MDSALVAEEVRHNKRLVARVAQRINEEDKEKLAYLYDLPDFCHHASTTALKVLRQLEMRNVISPSAPAQLVQLLRTDLGREDLAKDVEKRIKQDSKDIKKKAKEQNAKLRCTTNDVRFRTRFDLACTLAELLAQNLEELKEDLVKDGDEHHQEAEPLLGECKRQAGGLVHSIKRARSAAKVSDKALALLHHLGSAEAAAQEVLGMATVGSCLTGAHSAEGQPPDSSRSPALSRRGPEVKRKPLLHLLKKKPHPEVGHTPTHTNSDIGEPCEYYVSTDLLESNPQLWTTLARSAPNSPCVPPRVRCHSQAAKSNAATEVNPKREAQCSSASHPASSDSGHMASQSFSVARDKLQNSLQFSTHGPGPHSAPNSPAIRRHSHSGRTHMATGVAPPIPSRRQHPPPIQETSRSPLPATDEDLQLEENSDATGGSTGDSGFGEPLLKTPLAPKPKPRPHVYTPIHHETKDEIDEYIVPVAASSPQDYDPVTF